MEEEDFCWPVTETTAESSEACPTEDAIRALLENLVDPLLPFNPSTSDVPSKALRESVAKQVRAVVLLYNYYHRRKHPHLECLSFESFRSLTTVMRPALLPHWKESGEVKRDGDSEQTLLLEKAIVDACSLSMSLDASSDLSSLKKLPIRKVAVMLVDSQKKSCYLQHSSITQGVWSLFEKEKTAAEDQNEEAIFQKLAFAAIKEATGVNHNGIVILERHLVYSLSEEKTATRFYIMKCTSQEKITGEAPVEEVLDCMQGPLFVKSFTEWATKPIVEYFHVLPYANVIADWFSRPDDTEFVIEKEAKAVNDGIESNGTADVEVEVSDIPGRGENAASKRSYDTNVKKYDTMVSNPRAKRKAIPRRIRRTNVAKEPNVQLETVFALRARNVDNEKSPLKERYSTREKNGLEVESDLMDHRERCIEKKKAVADSILKLNAAPVSAHNSDQNLEELQTTLLSKATSLSETALNILLCKRDKLTFQQRYIEDEIEKCDKCIKDIKDDWELQLETILECCNEAYPRRILEESSDKSASKRVDNICLENNWLLPNYRVSPSDGGFEAEVRIKESHLAFTICGEEKSNAKEARESAAACLLTRLYPTTQQ